MGVAEQPSSQGSIRNFLVRCRNESYRVEAGSDDMSSFDDLKFSTEHPNKL